MKKVWIFILLIIVLILLSYRNKFIDYFDSPIAWNTTKENDLAYKMVDRNNILKTPNNKNCDNVFTEFKKLNTKQCGSNFTNSPDFPDANSNIPDSCEPPKGYLNRSYAYGQRESNCYDEGNVENFAEINPHLMENNTYEFDSSHVGNNKKLSDEEKFDSSLLLPKETKPDWFNDIPYIMSDFDAALANSTRHIGVDTIGTSNRNASQDLRGDPMPIVKFMTGPWNQSSIDQKITTRNISCTV